MSDQLQAARDQIAEMCGYKCDRSAGMWFTPSIAGVRMVACYLPYNPIPASLDFVSRVWPDRWEWWRFDGTWSSSITHESIVLRTIDTNDELANRMSLLRGVLRWLRDNDRPAFDAACEKIRNEIP